MSPSLESQLLLCCSRVRLDGEAKTKARALIQQELDWSSLLQAAVAHGVGPLLYKSLRTAGEETIPPTVLVWLRKQTQQTFVWSSLLAKELLQVLDIFTAHNLSAIPYKGPVLAISAYGDLALRPFGDLDIWVHRRDMRKAKELLLSLGYQPGYPDKMRDEEGYLRSHHDFLLIKKNKEREIHLDLQWGVTQETFTFPIEFQSLWERQQKVSLLGKPIANLSTEETLLILCVHGAKHGWNRLMWVCDIAELLRVNSHIDWAWLIEHAGNLGGRRMLLFGLHLANTLLDAELPAEVVRQIQEDPAISSLAQQVREELLRGMYNPSGLFEERPFFYMKLRERWQDQTWLFLHYCPEYLSRMVTPNDLDHAFLPLPHSLSFLYYFVRPVRLLSSYVRQTFGSSQQS